MENKHRKEALIRAIQETRAKTGGMWSQIEVIRKGGDGRRCECVDREFALVSCGHSFCGGCFDAIMESGERTCPVCRCPFESTDIVRIQWEYFGAADGDGEDDEKDFEVNV
jgi:hypothetical protein